MHFFFLLSEQPFSCFVPSCMLERFFSEIFFYTTTSTLISHLPQENSRFLPSHYLQNLIPYMPSSPRNLHLSPTIKCIKNRFATDFTCSQLKFTLISKMIFYSNTKCTVLSMFCAGHGEKYYFLPSMLLVAALIQLQYSYKVVVKLWQVIWIGESRKFRTG